MKIEIDDLIGEIHDVMTSVVRTDESHERMNIVDGLFAIAKSIDGLSREVRKLGNGNACTDMGAIEALGVVFKDGFETLGQSIQAVAEAKQGDQ